jgi:hypothetical protein
MLRSFALERSFEVPHRSTIRDAIKSWIKSQRHTQSTWLRSYMRSRNLKIDSVPEAFLNRNFKPSKQLQRIQMIKRRKRVELVQARHNISVFNVGQSADVHYEIGAATHQEFIARSLNITVCRPKSLTDLAQSQSGQHGIPLREGLTAVSVHPNYHSVKTSDQTNWSVLFFRLEFFTSSLSLEMNSFALPTA